MTGRLPELPCFPGDLNQVWTNIIDNAIAAMTNSAGREGGVLTVRTGREGDDSMRIEICDTGSGIPDDIRGRIFEPFFTTKAVGEGTGLGLDLAWQIVVKMHHGDLRVSSEPGDTRFIIVLPIEGPGGSGELAEDPSAVDATVAGKLGEPWCAYTQYGTRARYCRIANSATIHPSTVSTSTTTQCRNSCGSPSSGARTISR